MRIFKTVLLSIFVVPLAYALAMGVLGVMGTGGESERVAPGESIEIFVSSNGVHTDIIMPVVTSRHDWRAVTPGARRDGFVAIGWGDREFYLATPTWAEVKAGTVFRAVFGLNPTVLHVQAAGPPVLSERVRAIRLDPARFARLAAYIDRSFERDPANGYRLIAGAHYHAFDLFYEAKGRYSAIMTCNEWVRLGLAEAGVRTPVWSPFTWAIFHHVPAGD